MTKFFLIFMLSLDEVVVLVHGISSKVSPCTGNILRGLN